MNEYLIPMKTFERFSGTMKHYIFYKYLDADTVIVKQVCPDKKITEFLKLFPTRN
jgi:hypothetical protein